MEVPKISEYFQVNEIWQNARFQQTKQSIFKSNGQNKVEKCKDKIASRKSEDDGI